MSAVFPRLLALIGFMIGSAGVAWSQPSTTTKTPGGSDSVQRADASGDPLPPGAITRFGTLRLQHGGGVSNLLYTRDGKGLVSAGGEPIIRLWDPATGKELRRFVGHEGPVNSLALSLDGKMLASGGEDQTIRLWDVATGRELKSWSVGEGAGACVAFSPDGKVLASGGKGSAIVLWDVHTAKELRQFKGREQDREGPWRQSEGFLYSLAVAPDGRHILAAQAEGLVLWDLTTGKRVRNYEPSSQGGWSVGGRGMTVTSSDVSKTISFAADGQTFVMPGHHGPIRLWELSSVEERGRLEGHDTVVLATRFAPDGKTLVSASFDGTLRIWDVGALKELFKIDIGKDVFSDLAISPDGQTAALGSSRGRIRLWDLKTGKERAGSERSEPAAAIGFTADGRSVVSLDTRSIRRWDATTGKELSTTNLAEEKEPAILRLSPDRRLLAQARPGQPIRLLDAATGKEVRVLEGKHEQVLYLVFAPDGKSVAAATMANDPEGRGACVIRLWDATTGKEIQQLPRPAPVTALAISADARTVVSAEAYGGFRLWELATGQERRRLAVPSRARLSGDELMELRMVMRMRAQREDEGTERASPLVFTPDGKGLSVDEGAAIRVWDLVSGKIIRRFACDASITGEFAFSPDGRWLAAGGPDNAVWIWSNASTELLARLKGHRGPVHRLAFSSDSKSLVSASEDGTAVVWGLPLAMTSSRSQPRGDPTDERLAALWADLADADATRAYAAILKLAEAPKLAVRLLRDHLRPAPAPDSQRVAELIVDLDDSEFQVREKAAEELGRLHELVAPALDKALAAGPALEPRRRLESLLQKIQRRQLPAETVRALRAVELLEAIGTPEARQLLGTLATGVPEARLTKEARAALDRMAKQAGSNTGPRKESALGSSRSIP